MGGQALGSSPPALLPRSIPTPLGPHWRIISTRFVLVLLLLLLFLRLIHISTRFVLVLLLLLLFLRLIHIERDLFFLDTCQIMS